MRRRTKNHSIKIDWLRSLLRNECSILSNLLLKAIEVSRALIVQRKMLFTGPHFRERILPCYFFGAHVIRHFLLRLFSCSSYEKTYSEQPISPTESTSFTCLEILNSSTEKNPIKFDRCSRERENPKDMFVKAQFHNRRNSPNDEFEFLLSLTEWWIVVRTDFIFLLLYLERFRVSTFTTECNK